MTIYFDENKKAYGYVIDNPICSIEDSLWVNYAGTEKWDIIDGVFTDITDTAEYIAEQEAIAKEARKSEILEEIEETDIKRIRALAEGGNFDEDTTWLEYYNQQIINLRSELQQLS